MSYPLISIVIATLNSERFLKRCVESILAQTYNNWEIIIIDGKSMDDTKKIIKSYEEKISYWISEPDRGVYDAWNKALDCVNGEWVVFLGSDDFYVNENVLQRCWPYLEYASEKRINIVYGRVNLVSRQNEKWIIQVFGDKPWPYYKKRFNNCMGFSHTGVFHRGSLFDTHGRFDTRFKIGGDYEFLLRELKSGRKDCVGVDFPIVNMSEGGMSSSISSKVDAYKEGRIARRLHNIGGVSWSLSYLLLKARASLLIKKTGGDNMVRYVSNIYRLVSGRPRRRVR